MALPSLDFATDAFMTDARKRMVDSQLRPNKVSEPRLVDAMRHLPRERFLPASLAALAYADQNVPLGGGRVMPQPMVLARLVQAAAPVAGEKALVVGAGTGYSAALLAALGCEVVALEEDAALLETARSALAAAAPAVTLVAGPLTAGWPGGGPYDLILIDGAVPGIPAVLAAQLKPGTGRLMAIVANGDGRTSQGTRADPTPAGVSTRPLFDCPCPLLPGFAPAPAFQF